jgi:trk system potassium uptake protein TrkH|tara:strand:- start:225 stop:1673 length:1449 start_codon:yes stop_codon:yes gene_type:complete
MYNYKTVFYTLGTLQIVLGVFMLIPVIVQIIYNQLDSGFISASIITVIFGVLFFLSNLDHDKNIDLPQAFILTALSWLSVAIFGSLPFIFSDLNLDFTDAFFESMSGITTTGSTILTDLDNTPKAILLWRAILQWLGGIGIILMAITLMPIMNIGGMQLFKISSQDTAEKILPKSKEISVRLVFIYSSLTLICAVFYKIFGMNYFDSLTHSMTTIATGGFSNYNDSIGHFNSTLIEMNAVIFIILGSIPFISYIKYLNGDKSIFYKDAQISFFIKTIIVSIIIIYIFLFFKNYESETFLIRQVIFNVVSILTGTGYVTTNYSEWGNFSLIFFIVLMFIGGCAGSTACGLKIFRIHILYKFFVMQLKKYIYPRGIFVLKYSDNVLNEKFISSIISFVFLYIIIFFVITTLLSISGLDFVTAVSGAATSISNVGPGLGNLIGPNGNFSLLPDFSKWVLSAGMILGRLELFAIIVLFIPSFWRRY